MKKFPSIEQFRNVVKEVRLRHDFKGKDENGKAIYLHNSPYPTLDFTGTVKIHGTNAGIVKYSDGRIDFQSRERVLSLDYDNAGFMCNFHDKHLSNLFNFEFNESIAIYGEWCGKGIQKGVAVSELEKRFVIFAVKVDDEWIDFSKDLKDEELGIYNIKQFPTFRVSIDFNSPELIQNHLIELTQKVEEQCPIGSYFGIEGIGEGLVFTCDSDLSLMFKSKGEKHSVTKVKVLNSVDVEILEGINSFLEMVLTENRLNQGLTYFLENGLELEMKNIGEFIRWVVKDVFKEESDTIQENNLDDKMIKSEIAKKSKLWYTNKL